MSKNNLTIIILTALVVLIVYLFNQDNNLKYENFYHKHVCCWSKDTNNTLCDKYNHTPGKGYCSNNINSVHCDKDADCNPPTNAPTNAPTQAPTNAPTNAPTQAPTNAPTQAPTNAPTQAPIKMFPCHYEGKEELDIIKKSATNGSMCYTNFDTEKNKKKIAWCTPLRPAGGSCMFDKINDCGKIAMDGDHIRGGTIVNKNGVVYCEDKCVDTGKNIGQTCMRS